MQWEDKEKDRCEDVMAEKDQDRCHWEQKKENKYKRSQINLFCPY